MSNTAVAQGAWKNAVQSLNTKGANGAVAAYGVLKSLAVTPEDKAVRTKELSNLNQIGRVLYTFAALQDFVNRAKLQNSFFKATFSGVRLMCAVAARGTYYMLACDVSMDMNGGTVVTQWVTKEPVSEKNIPVLLKADNPELRQSELGAYFERYSTINAVAGSVRRTPEGMENFVLKSLTEKLRQMRN